MPMFTVLYHDIDETESLVVGTYSSEHLARRAAFRFLDWYYPSLDTIWNPEVGQVSWKNHTTGESGWDELIVLKAELDETRISSEDG